MAKFCTKCGAALTGVFCVKCGADMRQPSAPTPQSVPQNMGSTVPEAAPSPQPVAAIPPSTNKKMSPLAKLGIAAVILVFAGGALAVGGIYYAVHRVSQKIHEETGGILGSSSDNSDKSDSSSSADNSMGNVCRFLSKEDVSKAIGVQIIRAEAQDNSCNYIAKGTQADMMAKHATAMAATRGADQKTQQMLQQFAGGMFKAFQNDNKDSKPDTGEVPVFNFSVNQSDAAEAQMRLNAKGLGRLGDMQDLPGVGDQAFVSSDGMIMARKGNKLAVIMFLTCPCGVEAVKPLAKEIADAL